MKTSTNRPEPLESRIAPARIIDVGVPNNPGDFDYNEAPFVNTETAPGSDLIAAAVGGGIIGAADTFYMRLSKGDEVRLFRFGGGASTEPFLIVNSGNIIAFFTDKNLDNEVQESEITGISIGKGASFELRAALPGDAVANLDEKGSPDPADDALIMGGPGALVSEKLNIGGIRIGSSIGGSVDEGIVFQTAIEAVMGAPAVQEVQTFTLTTPTGDVGATFRLGVGGFTTAPLLATASPDDVRDALNGLSNVAALGGVTVTAGVNPGDFSVTYNLAGDQTQLIKVFSDTDINLRAVETTVGTPALQEVQSVDIGILAGRIGQMVYSFLGSASPGVALDATAAEVEAALNAMTPVADAGGVAVSGAVGGPFTITFNLPGDQLDVFTLNATGFAGVTVGGKVLSAGNINNVTVVGAVDQIRAGSAANGQDFDFFPKFIDAVGRIVDTPGGNGTFAAAPSAGKAGASISTVVVDRLGVLAGGVGSIVAGDGGEGGAGGFVKQVEIRNDSDGFNIFSGFGGDAGVKKKGGAGGSISNVYVDGVSDDTGNSLITIGAGAGGDATVGPGGIGGALSNVYIGFRLLNKSPLPTEAPLRDNLFIFSGDGGDGKVGGKGAAITNLNVLVSAPDVLGDEIVVVAGDGGDGSVGGGRGGLGGSITKSVVRNVDFSFGHDILVLAGNGGGSAATTPGAAGGSVQTLTTVGREITVFAGDGSDGKAGGLGGSIKGVTFDQLSGIFPTAVVLGAGVGGNATSGTGGRGGDVTTVRLSESDLTLFDLNPGSSANGGLSDTGRGGSGGIVKDVQVSDVDRGVGKAALNTNVYALRAGDGGDGGKGGGAGGSVTSVAFDGNEIVMDVAAGFGGNALVKGNGGAGGSITSAALSVEGQVYELLAGVPTRVNASSILTAGIGGDGQGPAGKGGAGGNITSVNLRTPGDGSLFAGDGGGGTGTAAAGRGGTINLTGLFAIFGSAEMVAGSAGAGTARPAAGGSVTGKSLDSLSSIFGGENLTLLAGDGTGGGAGGSLKYLGYGSFHEETGSLVPTPLGDVLVAAGDGSGSADGRFAGAGGSIIGVNGSVSFTAGTTTSILAGAGGSTPKKGAAGGSIENFILQRGGNPVTPGVDEPGVELIVEAGDAGDSPLASVGAKGGRINGFTMIDVSQGAIFRHLSAGDGGDAAKKGGLGGSINDVNVVGHDIGLRAGAPYGYNQMGGVFAGAGGAATTPGLGGDVTNVVADSISSIAAGKNAIPQLANKVSGIYLTGSNLLQIDDLAFQRGFPGGSENDNFPGIPGTTVVYSFGGDSTNVPLTKDATPAVVADALNALPSIAAAGGVSVTALLPTGYQINFASAGDRTPITAEEILGLNATEILGGEADSPLPVTELVQGSTALNIREIQTVRIDPLLLGRLTATFEGNSTSFPSATSLTGASGAAVLQAKLNLMPSVVSAGRVSVVALPSPATPNTFQITFDSPGDMPAFDFLGDSLPLGFAAEITQGSGGVRETQRFTVFPNAAAGPGGNPPAVVSTFQISFGANKTNFLPVTSTAAQITTALNALPSIIAAGLVDVTANPTSFETFEVRFRTNGDRVPMHILNQVTQGAVTSRVGVATTMTLGNQAGGISEVQRLAVPSTGLFSFAFGSDATPFMPPGTDPLIVSANLNNLPSITNAGGVFVTASPTGTYYEITFANADPQPQLTGVAIQQLQTVTEVTPGVQLTNVREVQSIEYDPNGTFTVQYPTGLSAVETIHGTAAQGEKQVLDLSAVQAIPGATFNLSFGASTTPVPLASNATAAQIEAALDALPSIPAGGVAVVANGGGVFTVTFAQLADQPGVITGNVIGGEATSVISGADSPDVIRLNLQNALNALPSIVASGGVTVEIAEGNTMNVLFNTFGNKPSFGALNDVLEQQTIDLLSDGQYTLTFGAATTPRLPAGSTPADIQAALNALPSIPAGGVTVTGGVNNDFLVVFNQPGPVTDISATQFFSLNTVTTQEGSATLQERQAVTVPERYLFDPVTFGSANLVSGISDATDLNPHIFKWIDADGDGQFESGEQPIDGLVAARSFSQILSGMITEARFVGGEFTFTETTHGNIATNEVQTLFIKSDSYTLAFEGNETKSLPGKSNAAAISKALNALPSIIAAGGVTVNSTAANTFSIAFNLPGDRTPVLAPFFYDFNNVIL